MMTRQTDALFEVDTIDTTPTCVTEASYIVLASGLDAAVAEIADILPAADPAKPRRLTAKETDQHSVLLDNGGDRHTSPTFTPSTPPRPDGPRLFLVTAHGHNPSIGRRGLNFTHHVLTLATGFDDAVSKQSRGGEGVTIRFDVEEWPGRVYERDRNMSDPEFDEDYFTGQAGNLLRDIEAGQRQVTRVGDAQYTDANGKQVRAESLVLGKLVVVTTTMHLDITNRGRRYLAHLELRNTR